jgi:hypothetical protein
MRSSICVGSFDTLSQNAKLQGAVSILDKGCAKTSGNPDRAVWRPKERVISRTEAAKSGFDSIGWADTRGATDVNLSVYI